MDISKLASISIISVLGIVILVMSLNRQQLDTVGVDSSTPVVNADSRNNDIRQNNERLSQVESSIEQLTHQQEVILNSLKQLVALKKQTIIAESKNEPNEVETIASNTNTVNKSQQRIDEEEKNNQIFTQNETNFYNEAVDDSWRTNEESKLTTIFEQNQLSYDRLECRGTSCRVELASIDSQDHANDSMEKFIRALPNSKGQFKLEKQADGSLKTVMIFKPSVNN